MMFSTAAHLLLVKMELLLKLEARQVLPLKRFGAFGVIDGNSYEDEIVVFT